MEDRMARIEARLAEQDALMRAHQTAIDRSVAASEERWRSQRAINKKRDERYADLELRTRKLENLAARVAGLAAAAAIFGSILSFVLSRIIPSF